MLPRRRLTVQSGTILIFFIVVLGGCAGPTAGKVEDAPASELHPGACNIVLPDGRESTCQQEAVHADIEPNTVGFLCVATATIGSSGQVSLHRAPLSGEVRVRFAGGPDATSYLIWLPQGPESYWEYQDSEGNEVFSLGVLPAGTAVAVAVYRYDARDAKDPERYVWVTSLWTLLDKQPYAVHEINVAGDLYYVDAMHPGDGGLLAYRQGSFEVPLNGTRVVADLQSHFEGSLNVGEPLTEC